MPTFLKQLWAARDVQIPIHVTRKNNEGLVGTWTIGALPSVALGLLVQVNLVLWGIVGVVEALKSLL